jgi:hypothetical protein
MYEMSGVEMSVPETRGVDVLESNKSKHLDTLLKTLTPRQTLTWRGFQRDQVKLCGRSGEDLRDGGETGFGDAGETVQERW